MILYVFGVIYILLQAFTGGGIIECVLEGGEFELLGGGG